MTKRLPTASSYVLALVLMLVASSAQAAGGGLLVPLNRAELVDAGPNIGQILVADPDIADIYAHGNGRISIIGKKLGSTNIRIFNKSGAVVRNINVSVGYDIPAIRRALWKYIPDEKIGVDMINSNIVLTGSISNAAVAVRAVEITEQFTKNTSPTGVGGGGGGAGGGGLGVGAAAAAAKSGTDTSVLNLMTVAASQQVSLRVRVGEIRRTALKDLGVSLQAVQKGGAINSTGVTNTGFTGFTPTTNPVTGATVAAPGFGTFTQGSDAQGNSSFAGLITAYTGRHFDLGASLDALEQDGLFKVLAEPNLVAISGEKAEFLAGGELPVPSAQASTGGSGATSTVEFKPYGVAIQFIPFVISENKIRINVQPEVSEIDPSVSTTANGITIPGIITRRAKTTVELAPGESFMIAGLLSDRVDSNINQVPGIANIPILSALFRSTQFRRNETELVIAVTPYIVDPLKSSDVRLPTDDFRPASTMERFFYGALGSLQGNTRRLSENPSLEGPIGFMTD